MTVFFKSENKQSSQPSDRARMRDKIAGLFGYIVRADIAALARSQMATASNAYHADLARYMHRDDHTEEVAAVHTRNLLTADLDTQIGEMDAIREAAGVGDGAVEHYILSLRAGEAVTEHLEEACEIFLKGQGLGKCPAVAAVHLDTDNPHIHLMVLRVDVTTLKEAVLPKYDIIRGHQLMAVMEDRFGWTREDNARWEVQNGRLILDSLEDVGAADKFGQWPDRYFPETGLSARAKAIEAKSGIHSAERIVTTIVPKLIEKHADLPDLLKALRAEGITLYTSGSGARYSVSMRDQQGAEFEESCQASVIRNWSYGKLTKKYGPLPKLADAIEQPRSASSTGKDPQIAQYYQARRLHSVQINRICADVRGAARGMPGLAETLNSGRLACAFPAYSEWQSGATANDLCAYFAATLGIHIVEPKSHSHTESGALPTSDASWVTIECGRRKVHRKRDDAYGACKLVDFGDRIIFVGTIGKADLEKAIILLQERGATSLLAQGFSKAEFELASKIAASRGIKLARASRWKMLLSSIHKKHDELKPAYNPEDVGKSQPPSTKENINEHMPKNSVGSQAPILRKDAPLTGDARLKRSQKSNADVIKHHNSQQSIGRPETAASSAHATSQKRMADKVQLPRQILNWQAANERANKFRRQNAMRAEQEKAERERDRLAFAASVHFQKSEFDQSTLDTGLLNRLKRHAQRHSDIMRSRRENMGMDWDL